MAKTKNVKILYATIYRVGVSSDDQKLTPGDIKALGIDPVIKNVNQDKYEDTVGVVRDSIREKILNDYSEIYGEDFVLSLAVKDMEGGVEK